MGLLCPIQGSPRKKKVKKIRSKALYSIRIHDTLYPYDQIKHLRCGYRNPANIRKKEKKCVRILGLFDVFYLHIWKMHSRLKLMRKKNIACHITRIQIHFCQHFRSLTLSTSCFSYIATIVMSLMQLRIQMKLWVEYGVGIQRKMMYSA